MCSLNVQHGLLSLGGFQRGKSVGLFSALPVDSSWSCGKWGLRPAREVGTQASPGAGPHPHGPSLQALHLGRDENGAERTPGLGRVARRA